MNMLTWHGVIEALQLIFALASSVYLGMQLFVWDQSRRDGHALAQSGRDGALKLIAAWNKHQESLFLVKAVLFVAVSVIRMITDEVADSQEGWEVVRLGGLIVILLVCMLRTALSMRVRAELTQYSMAITPEAPPSPVQPSQAITAVTAVTADIGVKDEAEVRETVHEMASK